MSNFKRVGEFLVENGIITEDQLRASLELQKDNPQTAIGQVMVTLGYVSKEELIMAMEMYMIATGTTTDVSDEWLDQEEIDSLLDRIKTQK
ncbi:MAG TPA: hypothetical protein PK624_08545 [Spirochaetota bacterium]|jgi:hypothetical protein|nr:hypothetical protein [Spirochaetota bacterium]MBP9023742.1 hypothetical protein [Spirochaetota bacterium]HOF34000.1 hypothetical protein [Spirochaetota bacterium]HOR44828.1 hypothetical protein [Spirochaetota bacterium]HPA62330.1 hypothetical protein [Spirochaetota bacterium]